MSLYREDCIGQKKRKEKRPEKKKEKNSSQWQKVVDSWLLFS